MIKSFPTPGILPVLRVPVQELSDLALVVVDPPLAFQALGLIAGIVLMHYTEPFLHQWMLVLGVAVTLLASAVITLIDYAEMVRQPQKI